MRHFRGVIAGPPVVFLKPSPACSIDPTAMRIECPTCNLGFNVSDDQVGTKGLCPKCETKFIIPADPDAEIDVLEEGVIGEDEKVESKRGRGEGKSGAEAAAAKEEGGKGRERREGEGSKGEGDEAPPTQKLADDVVDDGEEDFDTGGLGRALGLIALGLLLGLALGFALGRMTAEEGAGPTKPADAGGVQSQGDTTDPFGIGDGSN